ncbi:MAG TPA: protein kinase [Kofleriaceae bacterium]|nr:protein kinase [Kofleriaceae bacterium]
MTRYELLDRIGVGGMAEIFRGKAVAAGGFEKPVAIKRILPHLSQDKRFVELLIAEAKVLSLLKHRNIVQIFDVGLGDDGKYFLVMEYVDGRDLGAVQRGLEARRRRVPFDLVLHVGAEICEALEHAHSARAPDGKPMSLVHRDVSPSNVLLSRAGEVKLTDFGIAKRAEQEATGHGAVRGKFAYISPEQARNEHLDPRSDVFSVGILLWELITSRRLFSGLPDMEALRGVREAQVPHPRDVDSRLSPDIDALIMSALARDARNRPTAGQLGARLRSLRYALDVTVGDPATELAKMLDTAEEAPRQGAPPPSPPPSRVEFDAGEATVIRIHTADEFSLLDKDGSQMARVREVIDRFEEEETRQAQLSQDQIALLRSNATRDSAELVPAEPPLPGVRPWRSSDEATSARGPLSSENTVAFPADAVEASPHFEGDEATLLLPPSMRRTPMPEPGRRPVTQPPPLPVPALSPRPREPTPGGLPHTPPPGTIHDRGRGMAPPGVGPPASIPQGPLAPVGSLGHPPPGMAPLPAPPAMLPSAPPLPLMPHPPMAPAGLPPHAGLPMAPAGLPPHAAALPVPPQSPPLASQMPPGNYWGMPQLPMGAASPAMPLYDRQVAPRAAAYAARRPRRPALQPWMLVIGALLMALLAFTVTRACIHTATSRPAAESK